MDSLLSVTQSIDLVSTYFLHIQSMYKKQPCIKHIILQFNLVTLYSGSPYGLAARLVIASVIAILVITVILTLRSKSVVKIAPILGELV